MIRILLLCCVIVWGWTFVATKICLKYLDPVELIGSRLIIGLPLLFAVIRIRKIPFSFARRDIPALALGSLIITAHFLIQAVALTQTSATHTGWIIAVTPLALILLSFLFLRETLAKREVAGIIVSTLGILILVSGGKLTSLEWLSSTGDWLILASAHTWAFYTIVSRNVSRNSNPLCVTAVMFTPLAAGCAAVMAIRSGGHAVLALPAEGIIALLFLGILGTLTQWIWQEGVARIGAARAGVYLYLEPVATTALAVPLLGEEYGPPVIAGGLLVLSGVWWAQRASSSRASAESGQPPAGSTRR